MFKLLFVPNQRAKNKKLIGGQVTTELREAVDAWLMEHPGRSTTYFLVMAFAEKLQREGIPVDIAAALRDNRIRIPERPSFQSKPAGGFEFNEKPNSRWRGKK